MTKTPWGPLGLVTYKRTYSRVKEDGKKEDFTDTIDRVLDGCDNQLKVKWDAGEREFAREMMLGLKGIVAGRFLWQLGTDTVSKLGLASLQNCAGVAVDAPIRPFTWAMDALMLGAGVGFNIQKEYVYEIPKVKKGGTKRAIRVDENDVDFIVPDSREGWVKLLYKTLEAYFITGKSFTYSTLCVRGRGTPIKSFGGTASGPEILCEGMEKICEVLDKRAGKKVGPVDCLDIMNIIGSIVVAGNVRRSAQLAVGDVDDTFYLAAKNWDTGTVPNWRAMSNNSVTCNDVHKLTEGFWETYNGGSEPFGLINLKLSRGIGRTGDTDYSDKDVVVFNPCAEQSLENYETCCLAETYLPNIDSKEELIKVATTLYKICKHSLALPCHYPETEEVVHRNMRMGIGITGYLQATEEQRSWLSDCYLALRKKDIEYSRDQGFPESIKLTTVKPSGTLSLLAGVTSGCHPGYSQHFIRRIRIATESPLVQECRDKGYHVEFVRNFDGTDNRDTVVVEFPCKHPEGTTLAKDMTAIDQLKVVKRLQTEWSDNAVSCTVYYRKEELPEIQEYLKEFYNDHHKTISFLLHSEHGFDQAPLEEITKEKYEDMFSKVKPFEDVNINEKDMELDECISGACPVK